MPLEFVCTACHQMLRVGTRKAGSSVKCPRCQASIVVPTEQQVAAAQAMRKAIQPPSAGDVNLRDIAALEKLAAGAVRPEIAVEAGRAAPTKFDKSLVTFPRRVLYAQAVVLVAAVALAFWIGFASGRGQRALEETAGPAAVSGTVVYISAEQNLPDAGAVIIAVPQSITPRRKVPSGSLGPSQAAPVPGNQAVDTLETLGGGYARADDQGRFQLNLPHGRYQFVVVSAHAMRALGEEPAPADLAAMGQALDAATELIGPSKHLLTSKRLPDESPLAFEMGASGN